MKRCYEALVGRLRREVSQAGGVVYSCHATIVGIVLETVGHTAGGYLSTNVGIRFCVPGFV